MRKQTVLLLIFAVGMLAGCGDNLATIDAVVTGPTDSTFTINPPGGGSFIVRPLDFQVADADGVPLAEVEIELFANGEGELADITGDPLDPTNLFYYKTETDDRGVVRVAFITDLPACDAAADVTVGGGVTASVGVASAVWTVTYTVKQC